MDKMDELFREQLANHEIAPPAAAWGKVETSIAPSATGFRWRIAAGIAAAALLVTWFSLRQSDEQQIANVPSSTPAKETPAQKETTTAPVVTEPVASQQAPVRRAVAQGNPRSASVAVVVDTMTSVQHTELVADASVTPAETTPAFSEVVEPHVAVEETAAPDMGTAPQPTSMVITYSLEAVEPVATAEETPAADEKPLKKMVNIARDIKNSDSPIENLREMKADLFAFNPLRKNQNKKH